MSDPGSIFVGGVNVWLVVTEYNCRQSERAFQIRREKVPAIVDWLGRNAEQVYRRAPFDAEFIELSDSDTASCDPNHKNHTQYAITPYVFFSCGRKWKFIGDCCRRAV